MPVAIITGANRGLGLEFTRQCLEDDWRVITINRRSSGALDTLAERHPLTILEADLTDDASLARAVEQIAEPKIDLLVNNAGIMGDASFAEVGVAYQIFGSFDRDEWHRVFDINVCTPMALTELLADKLEAAERPIVITMSSMLGSNALNTMGNVYAYRASKAAVNSIMKSMGRNLGPRGIICIAMHPGWVKTELGGPNAEISPERSVAGMRRVLNGLTIVDSGRFIAWDGSDMPY